LARKILLADDSVTAQNMGRKILADAGYEVITVNNGSAALKKIAEHKPDVIVLDVYMPGYSGLEVCQRVKEAQETSRLPVLLTVGKLEPFKPEEAKRVRADGFIVKPFEASELLSALSKLEDKIVPRAEAKPGRFARANAALDEGKYDKTMAADEDSGWRNRIGFPSKKKEDAAEDADNSSTYNPMNKDLRTKVERKPEKSQPSNHVEEARVDLGALAPEGLPKDVTPEEIAALAAAAAQVKGKIAEVKAETPVEEKVEAKIEAKTEDKTEEKTEEKTEQKTEEAASPANSSSVSPDPVSPSPADVMAAIAGLETDAATSAAANSGNGSWSHGAAESTSGHTSEHAPEHTSDEPVTMAVGAAESLAATSRWTAVAVALAPEDAAISLEQEMQKAYAAFAAAEANLVGAHAAEPEMQPAVSEPAVFQPALVEPAAATENVSAAAPVPAEPAVAESTITAAAEPAPVASATPFVVQSTVVPSASASEVAETLSVMANAAADVVGEAVKELEAVAASYEAQKMPVVEPEAAAIAPAPADSAPIDSAQISPTLENSAQAALEAQTVASPSGDARVEVAPAEPTPETPKLEAAIADALEVKNEVKNQEVSYTEFKHEDAKVESPASEDAAAKAVETTAPPVVNADSAEPAAVSDVSATQISADRISEDQVSAARIAAEQFLADQISVRRISATVSDLAGLVAGYSAAGGIDDMAKKESEASAAAWASWRRIRETADPKAAEAVNKEDGSAGAAPQDVAAMAVAAGAEKAPEEMSAAADAKSADIASIVDSVLADLRPKIVEEISRQMGKKK